MAGHGLKKESKKLSKTLKSHRKRLESLLPERTTPQVSQQLSQADLHAVLSELAQLQSALAAVRHHKRELTVAAAAQQAVCDSDSDSSDCEEEEPQKRQRQRAVAQLQQSDMGQALGAQGAAAAANVGMGVASVCLQAPLVDQEQQPDVCQQLPPAQQYAAAGRVLVCQGKACVRKGALQVLQAVSHVTAASPGIEVLPCKCLGKCKQGPAMRVRTEEQQQPRSSLVTEIEPLEVPAILDQLLA